MKRKFAYLFPLGGRIEWSSETGDSLLKRTDTLPTEEKFDIRAFVWNSSPGMFIKLSTGEIVFCVA